VLILRFKPFQPRTKINTFVKYTHCVIWRAFIFIRIYKRC
jgi:hypothetical protein